MKKQQTRKGKETRWKISAGDCLAVMRGMDADSIDAVVCDPPYGLKFMSRLWDHGIIAAAYWREALRVAKPGAHLLAFGGTRTHHRLMCAIEDAGWEIRDCIMWVYGSGFPKSHDISKAIDKAAGEVREVVGKRDTTIGGKDQHQFNSHRDRFIDITAPATSAAQQWDGWGTALKPAWEPIIVARKPLCGTVAENVITHGTGGFNVEGCRVGTEGETWDVPRCKVQNIAKPSGSSGQGLTDPSVRNTTHTKGRWPANVIHDGSEEVVRGFPEKTSGFMRGGEKASKGKGMFGGGQANGDSFGDTGSASRFFYCAKASKKDRDEGCEGMAERVISTWGGEEDDLSEGKKSTLPKSNHHPTVKPTSLMRYLCRLVTPPGGLVLDPFMGSGSTGKAALLEGFRFHGIEEHAEYLQIARARVRHAAKGQRTKDK